MRSIWSISARVTISFYNEPLWFVIFNFTVGVDDAEGPPVPIPNTEVKLSGAKNSAPATGCENREMPTFKSVHPVGWAFLFIRRIYDRFFSQ